MARDFGDGDIRLTVWQNLLISGVADGKVDAGEAAIAALGLGTKANAIRAGLVACTGNAGCKFAASDTKRHAEEIADLVRGPRPGRHARQYPSHRLPSLLRAALSSARSACSPARCRRPRTATRSRAITSWSAAASAPTPRSAATSTATCKADDAPRKVEGLLAAYLAHRASPQESFLAFAARHDVEALKAMCAAEAAA